MILTWGDGYTLEVHIRKRWFPWPTDNVTFRRTIWSKSRHLTAPTVRHEGCHCRDWMEKGILWMLFHPADREARARAAETADYPIWS